MSRREVWSCRIVMTGVVINLIVATPILIAPAWALSLISAPQPEPIIYARLVGLLIILLSLFYLPAALDPGRYRLVAWIAVLARLAAAVFFVAAALALDARALYLLALLDFSFFLAQGVLLVGGLAEGRPTGGLVDRPADLARKSAKEGARRAPS